MFTLRNIFHGIINGYGIKAFSRIVMLHITGEPNSTQITNHVLIRLSNLLMVGAMTTRTSFTLFLLHINIITAFIQRLFNKAISFKLIAYFLITYQYQVFKLIVFPKRYLPDCRELFHIFRYKFPR